MGEGKISNRIDAIDALRGLACVWVLLLHASIELKGFGDRSILDAIASVAVLPGYLGVNLFLVLSGFCLYYPLARTGEMTVNYGAFMARRFRRINPPHYLVLAICLLLCWVPGFARLNRPEHWYDPLLHLLLLNNLTPSTISSINPAFWSLALEWQLYLVFPVFLWLLRRGGVRYLLIATLLVSLLAQVSAFAYLVQHRSSDALASVLLLSLPSRCFEFAAGMVAADCVARGKMPRFAGVAAALAAVTMFSIIPASRPADRQFEVDVYPFSAVVFAWLVAWAAMLPREICKSGPGRVAAVVGERSYSIYLVHYPVILAILPVLHLLHLPSPFPLAIVLAASIGVGALIYLLVERPFLKHRIRTELAVPGR